MRLTPTERDRLLIFTAAELARARRARGLRLNVVPELVPALVKRYIRELQQGKQPNTTGSVGESRAVSEKP